MASELSGKAASFWIDSTPASDYPALTADISVDIAIIGGAITGLTTALLLAGARERMLPSSNQSGSSAA